MVVAMDIETVDPGLRTLGSGAIRGDGRILGIGYYDGKNEAYCDPYDRRIADTLNNPENTVVFHNAMYDLDWLQSYLELPVRAKIADTMTRETLLDAYAGTYTLDKCCERRGVQGKQTQGIDDWYHEHISPKGLAVSHLAEMPQDVVARYCMDDCAATYALFHAQQPLLIAEDLLGVEDMESRLIPVLMLMRRHGVAIDLKRLRDTGKRLKTRLEALLASPELNGMSSLQSQKQMMGLFDRLGLKYPRDRDGKVTFAALELSRVDHPVIEIVREAKTLTSALNKFIDGPIEAHCVKARIHPSIIPCKKDDGGTVTGRMAMAKPNLQQMSSEDDKFGKEVREVFVPDEGMMMYAFDYSQLEYRVYANYATGPGAMELVDAYRNDPTTDYHNETLKFMGWTDRKLAKRCGFGSIYGLSPYTFEYKYATPKELYAKYLRERTYIRPTNAAIEETGRCRGYVRTLMRRKQRVPPSNKLYALVNHLVQGSAADIYKAGLVKAYEDGVFNICLPSIPVHDETVGSFPPTREGVQALEHLVECMRVLEPKMKVPLLVDKEIGKNWSECTTQNFEELKKWVEKK